MPVGSNYRVLIVIVNPGLLAAVVVFQSDVNGITGQRRKEAAYSRPNKRSQHQCGGALVTD